MISVFVLDFVRRIGLREVNLELSYGEEGAGNKDIIILLVQVVTGQIGGWQF